MERTFFEDWILKSDWAAEDSWQKLQRKKNYSSFKRHCNHSKKKWTKWTPNMEWTPREEAGFPQSLAESKERPASQLLERFVLGGERVTPRTAEGPCSSQVLWRMTPDK